jgi:hypothetical protein
MGQDALKMNDDAIKTIDQNQGGETLGIPLNQNCDVNNSTTTSALHATRKM